MNPTSLFRIRSGLWCGAALAVFAAFATMFHSGCIGDPKSGALGDPAMALEWEALAVPLSIGAILLMCLAIVLAPGKFTEGRLAVAIAAMLFGVFLFWLAAIQFQVWGIQACHGTP